MYFVSFNFKKCIFFDLFFWERRFQFRSSISCLRSIDSIFVAACATHLFDHMFQKIMWPQDTQQGHGPALHLAPVLPCPTTGADSLAPLWWPRPTSSHTLPAPTCTYCAPLMTPTHALLWPTAVLSWDHHPTPCTATAAHLLSLMCHVCPLMWALDHMPFFNFFKICYCIHPFFYNSLQFCHQNSVTNCHWNLSPMFSVTNPNSELCKSFCYKKFQWQTLLCKHSFVIEFESFVPSDALLSLNQLICYKNILFFLI